MTTCTVLIGTRDNHRECGLPDDPCSSHAAFHGVLPYVADDLWTRDEIHDGAHPVSPVRGGTDTERVSA